MLLPSAVGGVGQPAVADATNKAKESDDDSTEEAASVSHGGSSTWDDEAFCSRFPTALARGRSNGNEVVDLNSARHRLKLASTPKAGATVATQVMMRYLGLYEEATAYHPWIHQYRSQVFTKDPEHEKVSCQTHCRKKEKRKTKNGSAVVGGEHHDDDDGAYFCVKLIRSPLDRAVSSYGVMLARGLDLPQLQSNHTDFNMIRGLPRKKISDEWTRFLEALGAGRDLPQLQSNLTFFNMIRGLSGLSQSTNGVGYITHCGTQSSTGCDENSYLVPTEALDDSFEALRQIRSDFTLSSTNLSSPHYITKERNLDEVVDMSEEPPPCLGGHQCRNTTFPPYRAYYLNAHLNQEICRLYCRDVRLYVRTCSAELNPDVIRKGSVAERVCAKKLSQIEQVCGRGFVVLP